MIKLPPYISYVQHYKKNGISLKKTVEIDFRAEYTHEKELTYEIKSGYGEYGNNTITVCLEYNSNNKQNANDFCKFKNFEDSYTAWMEIELWINDAYSSLT